MWPARKWNRCGGSSIAVRGERSSLRQGFSARPSQRGLISAALSARPYQRGLISERSQRRNPSRAGGTVAGQTPSGLRPAPEAAVLALPVARSGPMIPSPEAPLLRLWARAARQSGPWAEKQRAHPPGREPHPAATPAAAGFRARWKVSAGCRSSPRRPANRSQPSRHSQAKHSLGPAWSPIQNPEPA
jgi:hypothetical protein